MENNSLKWYNNTNWVVFFLLIFPPAGIIFLWLKNNFLRIEKIGITIAAISIFLSTILFPQTQNEYILGAKMVVKIAFSFALILYGLKLFKIYIRIWGALIGFLLGFILGIFFETNPYIIGILFSIIGVLIAWFVQKALVFISVGLFFSVFSIIICVTNDIDPWVPSALIFIIAGIVAIRLYDYFVILSFSLPAALSIFHIVYSGQWAQLEFYWNRNNLLGTLLRLLETLGEFYKKYWLSLTIILLMFAIFSIYYQKFLKIKEGDSESKQAFKMIFKKMTFFFTVFLIFRYGFSVMVETNIYKTVLYFSNIAALLTFPIVVTITTLIFRQVFHKRNFSIKKQYLLILAIGIVVVPFISSLSGAIITLSFRHLIYILIYDPLQLGLLLSVNKYGCAIQYLMFHIIILPICWLYINKYLKNCFLNKSIE